MKRAFFACYEKDEQLLRLAHLLYDCGWTLSGSVGTSKYITTHGIPCRDISDIMGPSILRHRIVTLDRRIYAGLLAVTKEDFEELDRIGIQPIGLVYIRLYPIQDTIDDPSATPEKVLEKTDIGGPTILRAAAKGRRLALCNPLQIEKIQRWLENGATTAEREHLTTECTAEAERYVAAHVQASADYWAAHLDYPHDKLMRRE